jgi:hypothetical protein
VLYLEAKGGDGGRRYYNDGMLIDNHYADGGQGATLAGTFVIGTGPGQIPPGSTIRFIIGEKGGNNNSGWEESSGGGGGTGILFKPPGAGNGKWQHLIIAGGGGGAYADSGAIQHAGKGGEASPDCEDGSAGSGGGWKEGGKSAGEDKSGAAGWRNYDSTPANPGPIGGNGGLLGVNHGGWGYGGGGSQGYTNLDGGGGGGGACGGNGGGEFQPGNGGKSWMNYIWVWEEALRQNGGTVRDPQHGYAKYQIQELKRVFVTSTTHNGNLGGFAGADIICNNCASAAGLEGDFKAWLGDCQTGPVDNFVIDTSVIYTLVNGEFVGTWSDLIESNLKNPISVTEFGDTVTGLVWTGVYSGGTFREDSAWQNCCNNWKTKSAGYHGAIGDASQTDGDWTYETTLRYYIEPCSNKYRLYCFEQ